MFNLISFCRGFLDLNNNLIYKMLTVTQLMEKRNIISLNGIILYKNELYKIHYYILYMYQLGKSILISYLSINIIS